MSARRQQDDRDAVQLAASMAGYALGIDPAEITRTGRGTHDASRARQVAMYLAHVGMGMSLARVAEAFGRDRSTVAHACHLIEDRRDDAAFDRWLDQLERGVAYLAPLKMEQS